MKFEIGDTVRVFYGDRKERNNIKHKHVFVKRIVKGFFIGTPGIVITHYESLMRKQDTYIWAINGETYLEDRLLHVRNILTERL